jgi:glycosyltransferase involved in cell wall biosynthesis
VVFLQQRPFEEWYFPDLVPWLHYVPVARDLSDLVPALNRLRDDPELEQKIVVNAFEFAAARLTRAAAIRRWIDLLAACRESGGA